MTTPVEACLLAYPKLLTPMICTAVPKVTDYFGLQCEQ
jgi:hypothetical protein